MKHASAKRTLGILLACVMLIGLFPTTALTVYAATTVSGTQYASNLVDYDDIVLTGDTTLFVNSDVSLRSISGDYKLEIQSDGEHTLTVDNPNGCAISVNSLQSVVPSQGTVKLNVNGGSGYFAIAADGNISLDGVKLDVTGSSGIRSLNGNVTINGTNVSVVCQDGVGVIANSGSISIDSDYLFVQCAGQSGDAYWEHGIGAVKDITIISDDATITGRWGVDSDKGNITLSGNISVGATNCAVIANEGTITMTGAVTAQSSDEYYVIAALGDISFDGTKLDVKGSSGIRSAEGGITINGTNVSVVGQDGIGVIANTGSISIDSDYLFVQCAGQSGEAEWEHGIGAFGDITINSTDATITGLRGVYSQTGNITLSGKIDVGGTESAIYSKAGTITMTGAVTAQSSDEYYVIAALGDISFDGTKLDVKGSSGIRSAEGGITINGTHTSVVGQDGVGVIANSGSIYIDSDYLFVQCAGQSGDAEWEHGIGAVKDITIISDDATITGRWGVHSDKGNITLSGNICVGATKSAIRSDEGKITMTGSVTAQGGNNYFAMAATGDISFEGTKLEVTGDSGIRSVNGDITINGTHVSVVGQDGVGVIANSGSIYIDSNYLFVQCAGQSGDAKWEHGVGATNDVTIISDDATIAGRWGVYSETGSVTLWGNAWVGARKTAIRAEKNIVVHGDLSANNTDQDYFCVVSVDGDITLSNGTIDITSASNAVITHNGNIFLNGNITVRSLESNSCAINARNGDIVIQGGFLDVTAGGTYAMYAYNGHIGMNQPLELLVPTNGHIDTNTIVDTYGEPASHIKIGSTVGKVDIYLSTPSDGQAAIFDSSAVYGLPLLAYFDSIRWFENGVEMQEGDLFTAGNTYTAELILSAEDGYYFAEGVLAKVNNKDSSLTGLMEGGTKLMIRVNLGKCNTAISQVELDITAPVDGNKPSTGVSTPNGAHYGVKSSNVKWFVSDDGITYTAMAAGAKFVGGKYYRVQMDVTLSNSNYSFKITTADGSLQPDVAAFVGGNVAKTAKAYDQDPEQVVTVIYDFGVCNDTYIEDITIVDVVRPVAGQHPSYTANASGTGYRIDNSKNSYYDAYWVGEKWYYVKNGISWWDVTDGDYDYVYENDVFLPGHEYKCEIFVVTESGYEFVMDLYTEPETWPDATINGNHADVKKEGGSLLWNQEVSYTFACLPQVISTVIVNGIDTPKTGNKPDYTVSVAEPEYYRVESIEWFDCEYCPLDENDRFGDASPYRIALRIVSNQAKGVDLVEFANNVVVYIDGKEVTAYGQWDEVVVENGGVTAYYTYRNGSSAPEGEQVYSIGGSISVSGATVTLFQNGNVVTSFTANTSFSIDNLLVGIYVLQVSKDGYESYESNVYITGSDVVQDVTLVEIAPVYILGDADGNGRVNNRDLGLLQRFVNDWDVVIDEDASDVTGDGKINNRDLGLLQRYLNEWDVVLK